MAAPPAPAPEPEMERISDDSVAVSSTFCVAVTTAPADTNASTTLAISLMVTEPTRAKPPAPPPPSARLSIWASSRAVTSTRFANQVKASIRGAGTTVDANRVLVTALEDAQIESLALGGGGAGGFALVGSVTINEIANVVEAFVSAGAVVTATQNVELTATESSEILSISGSGAGAGGAAIGAAASYNSIKSQVRAYVDGATIVSELGSVLVRANLDPRIVAVAVGGAGAAGFALAGSAVVNDLAAVVEAELRNGADVTADEDVVVMTTFDGPDATVDPAEVDTDDTSFVNSLVDSLGLAGINGFAGSGAGAFIGAAGAAVVNLIANRIRAAVKDSTVRARGNGGGTQVPTFNTATGTVSTAAVRGLSVVAVDILDVDSIVITGAGG